MGFCQCGADDRYTHAHHEVTTPGTFPIVVLGKPAWLAPVYALNWHPWCAVCAEAAAKAGLFLFGAQRLHVDPFVTPGVRWG